MQHMKKWSFVCVSMCIVLLLAACSNQEEVEPMVFSDALEEYSVWLYVNGEPKKPTADSAVRELLVVEDGHMQQYILDDLHITLEEVTNYSDEELVTYVQEQLSTVSNNYEEPAAKKYTLDIHLNDRGKKALFMDIVLDDEDILFTFWDKSVSETIADTEFVGLFTGEDPLAEEEDYLMTRVDEAALAITLDEPDTTKEIVTVEEWMERQKQTDLESRNLQALHPAELEEIENHPASDIYAQSCLACHGDNLEGNIGPELTLIGDRLSEEEIKDIALNGTGNMPPGLVDNEEDAAVLAEWLSTYMKK